MGTSISGRLVEESTEEVQKLRHQAKDITVHVLRQQVNDLTIHLEFLLQEVVELKNANRNLETLHKTKYFHSVVMNELIVVCNLANEIEGTSIFSKEGLREAKRRFMCCNHKNVVIIYNNNT